jgi:sensor histidine kinase YesM
MIKDTLLKLIFTPLLGIVISLSSGMISFAKYSTVELIGGISFFIFVSYAIWKGCFLIHAHLRRSFTVDQNPFSKISLVCVCSGSYGTIISGLLIFTWLNVSKEQFSWQPVWNFMSLSLLAVVIFTLVYEVLYLNKERVSDNHVVAHLDHELSRVELIALRNELDPHFIFNSLSSLSHLISNDKEKARLFNDKLAQVYRYFLVFKDKDFISVEEEIDFIKSYFFLLQIRYNNRLKLAIELNPEMTADLMVVPCALQILVENAIKHNQFSEENPLVISIRMKDDYITVVNNLNSRRYPASSTKIGLKNLSSQYHLSCNKRVIVENSVERFIVKLPLIKQQLTC